MKEHNLSLGFVNHSLWKKLIKQPRINRKKADDLVFKAFPRVGYSVNKFINVKGNKSPFDGDLLYWSKRNSKYYDGRLSKVLRANYYRCHHCNHYMFNEEDANFIT